MTAFAIVFTSTCVIASAIIYFVVRHKSKALQHELDMIDDSQDTGGEE